jgi:hypothetical protein
VGATGACDSQPVSIGRAKIAATALVCAVGFAGTAAGPVTQALAKKRTKLVFFKARVASDGFLTPGQTESVGISHMPRRTDFKLGIEPPPTTLQCGQLYFCDVAPVTPAPATPPFVTNARGEAIVTFVMPTTYNLATDPFDPATRRPVTWANGQRVHIDVQGVKRKHRVKKIGFGFGRAAVQTP